MRSAPALLSASGTDCPDRQTFWNDPRTRTHSRIASVDSVNPNAYCKLQLTSEGTVEKGEVGQEKSGEIYDAMEEPASGFLNTIEQLLRPSGSRRT
mmetsp:Transcript_7812/g.28889  ORF Transcript_7812/g.28889 Transcript_7812/m.28889 type:complete len:96 (+) Transcript_7812:1050-1337(+)